MSDHEQRIPDEAKEGRFAPEDYSIRLDAEGRGAGEEEGGTIPEWASSKWGWSRDSSETSEGRRFYGSNFNWLESEIHERAVGERPSESGMAVARAILLDLNATLQGLPSYGPCCAGCICSSERCGGEDATIEDIRAIIRKILNGVLQ